MDILSESEINQIRGKLLVSAATQEEINDFLTYVTVIEGLVQEASESDFYGTQGYEYVIGWEG